MSQISQLRPVFFSYDLPEKAKLENPSGFLRRRAVRLQQSVWCMPNSMIPYQLISDLEAGGASVYVIAFDANEAETLMTILTDALKKEAESARRRAAKSIKSAEDAMIESTQGHTRAIDDFDVRVAKAVRRAETLLGDLQEAASVFGIDVSSLPIQASLQAVNVLQQAASNRAKAYAEMAKAAAQAAHMDAQAMATAAKADDVNPQDLADFLEENGIDASSQREAFAPATAE